MSTYTTRWWLGGLAGALTALPSMAQDLYVYPAKGQTEQQLSNDRYECHRWAVNETGFDPTDIGEAGPPRAVSVPVPENKAAGATGKGAIIGALAGAVLGHGDDKLKNTVIGATVGAAAGGAVEATGEMKAQDQARDEAQQRAQDMQRTKAEKAMRRANYRRALTACLEGRGYTVR
ncbi:MAG TPA: hypothetical protein VHH11_03270 [Gammaproteobacteria bacterium]|jgi:outer membrane lipoprotein SlyB|nr:hypothetical protein [Gammaproteobacteria bacterium]